MAGDYDWAGEKEGTQIVEGGKEAHRLIAHKVGFDIIRAPKHSRVGE